MSSTDLSRDCPPVRGFESLIEILGDPSKRRNYFDHLTGCPPCHFQWRNAWGQLRDRAGSESRLREWVGELDYDEAELLAIRPVSTGDPEPVEEHERPGRG